MYECHGILPVRITALPLSYLYNPVVFLGGGAGLMKRYLPQGSVLRPVILDDNKLNAQAYERLAGQVADHAG